MSRYMTIRATAKQFELPEWMLRGMQKSGTLPGFFAGSRFYCDTELLMQHLEAASKANVTRSVEATA